MQEGPLVEGMVVAGWKLLRRLRDDYGSSHWSAVDAAGRPARLDIAPAGGGRPMAGVLDFLSDLSGRGVAPVTGHGFAVDVGVEYLALRVPGPSLAEIALSSGGRLPVAAALAAAHGVAETLSRLHRAGVGHGDVHAGNVFVDDVGDTWLAGFVVPATSATPADDLRGVGVWLRDVLGDAMPGSLAPLVAPGGPTDADAVALVRTALEAVGGLEQGQRELASLAR